MIIFETERLVVRTYNEKDKKNFYLLNGNRKVMRWIRPVKTRKESDDFLLETLARTETDPAMGRWAVEEKSIGKFVGSFAIIPVENSEHIQLGYALLPRYWGKGYATELTKTGLHYVFSKTKLKVIYALTELPNLSSQKVLIKTGFTENGIVMEGKKELVQFSMSREEYFSIVNVQNFGVKPV
jgi:[ribosomal protein S5]-alanine N-acetyltransferase